MIDPPTLERIAQLSNQHNVRFAMARLHIGSSESWTCTVVDQLGVAVCVGHGEGQTDAADAAIEAFRPEEANKTPHQAAAEIAALKQQLAAAEAKAPKKA
jgi:hypothetical protein